MEVYNHNLEVYSKSKDAESIPHFFSKVKREFRSIDKSLYPSIKGYSDDDLYDHGKWLSPGGYLMLHHIAEQLHIKKGTRILDLGCGNGQSSIYFAQEFNANVVAVDLWIDAESRDKSAEMAGVNNKILNITADLSAGLGAIEGQFDYIISVQAFHCFGTNDALMASLRELLATNGKLGIIQSTFSKGGQLPKVFLESDGWETDYSTYHYTVWWKQHFEKHQYKILDCFELEQGKQIWEDSIVYYGKRKLWSEDYYKTHGWLMKHVMYNANGFYLTHFLLTATI